MKSRLLPSFVMLIVLFTSTLLARAESPDFITIVGHVEKFEKDTLKVTVGDKSKKDKSAKGIELSVTGTSKFHLLAPQVRAGKTVVTQRAAEITDLAPGQPIAAIYTMADKDNVLLTAVIKAADKAVEKDAK